MADEGGTDRGAAGRKARAGFDLVPVVALAGIVALLLAGWWLVPPVLSAMKHQRCVALGSTTC